MQTLMPYADFVLVEEKEKEVKSKSGLILTGETSKVYIVKACGPDAIRIEPGTEVLLFNVPGCIKLDSRFGENLLLCKSEQVLGGIKNE